MSRTPSNGFWLLRTVALCNKHCLQKRGQRRVFWEGRLKEIVSGDVTEATVSLSIGSGPLPLCDEDEGEDGWQREQEQDE